MMNIPEKKHIYFEIKSKLGFHDWEPTIITHNLPDDVILDDVAFRNEESLGDINEDMTVLEVLNNKHFIDAWNTKFRYHHVNERNRRRKNIIEYLESIEKEQELLRAEYRFQLAKYNKKRLEEELKEAERELEMSHANLNKVKTKVR